MVEFLMPLVLVTVIMYFFLLRPQQKRDAERKKMLDGIDKGDKIVLGGGMLGKVTAVFPDGRIEAEIAEGVKVKLLRSTVLMRYEQ